MGARRDWTRARCWLSRAVLAVRLRTFFNGDAAVSAALCGRLAESIGLGVLPALPRRSTGVAGEIVGLAHLGAALTGAGDVLARGPGAGTRLAGRALAEAGLAPLRLGPKEGVALIEGVPMTTALAVLAAEGAREVLRHALTVLAADDDRGAPAAGEQRPDLGGAVRVVEDDEHFPPH